MSGTAVELHESSHGVGASCERGAAAGGLVNTRDMGRRPSRSGVLVSGRHCSASSDVMTKDKAHCCTGGCDVASQPVHGSIDAPFERVAGTSEAELCLSPREAEYPPLPPVHSEDSSTQSTPRPSLALLCIHSSPSPRMTRPCTAAKDGVQGPCTAGATCSGGDGISGSSSATTPILILLHRASPTTRPCPTSHLSLSLPLHSSPLVLSRPPPLLLLRPASRLPPVHRPPDLPPLPLHRSPPSPSLPHFPLPPLHLAPPRRHSAPPRRPHLPTRPRLHARLVGQPQEGEGQGVGGAEGGRYGEVRRE